MFSYYPVPESPDPYPQHCSFALKKITGRRYFCRIIYSMCGLDQEKSPLPPPAEVGLLIYYMKFMHEDCKIFPGALLPIYSK
jgi:hypothetical protein